MENYAATMAQHLAEARQTEESEAHRVEVAQYQASIARLQAEVDRLGEREASSRQRLMQVTLSSWLQNPQAGFELPAFGHTPTPHAGRCLPEAT